MPRSVPAGVYSRGVLTPGSPHAAQLQAMQGAGAAGVEGGYTKGLLGQPGVSIPSSLPGSSSLSQPQSSLQSPVNRKMFSAPIRAQVVGERVLPRDPPSPPYPPAAGGASPPLREGVYPASPPPSPPALAALHREGGAGGEGRIAARTPSSSPSAWPGATPALPPPLHANDAAQRVRREEGGREEGGRGPPYLALSPPLPLTCSGRAMRFPASR